MQKRLCLTIIGLCILLYGCEQPVEKQVENDSLASNTMSANSTPDKEKRQASIVESENKGTGSQITDTKFKTIEWGDLIPKNDLDALLNPPGYLDELEDGSFEDQITNQIQNSITAANDDRYQQALVSTNVIPEMNNKAVTIPAFVVPLEFNEDQSVSQFFLVPYFGACIHQPPPPPNQIIFVNYPKGLVLNTLYDPYWISGILTTSLVQNEMATAAYTLEVSKYEIYTE
jgi:hypothetical protein